MAASSVVQRLLGGLECWGGKQGSSRRACSPAEARQDKNILGRTRGASAAAASTRVVVGADLDLLLEHVDLVLLLDQLLLLFGDLRHGRHVFTRWDLCYGAPRRQKRQHLLRRSWRGGPQLRGVPAPAAAGPAPSAAAASPAATQPCCAARSGLLAAAPSDRSAG